ncbi:hypothetical protein J3459_013555, partial [Metarhizium acridum]
MAAGWTCQPPRRIHNRLPRKTSEFGSLGNDRSVDFAAIMPLGEPVYTVPHVPAAWERKKGAHARRGELSIGTKKPASQDGYVLQSATPKIMSSVYRASRRYWIRKEDGGNAQSRGRNILDVLLMQGCCLGAGRTRSRQHALPRTRVSNSLGVQKCIAVPDVEEKGRNQREMKDWSGGLFHARVLFPNPFMAKFSVARETNYVPRRGRNQKQQRRDRHKAHAKIS